ncbi:phosphomannomutase : Phosphoglucomutase/phosphomannomutase family protein OS=Rhodopirellula sp. SWK7 GN=RRSWK_01118 PE=3 SV=1: PGM_PMM_I: PGM_PMM_II: PGM_PMM_III: PGM_PMM_IV [Gemmataceae bacterium]|nr:phosphomannomutase : Phosphoglucomutase/phosphomannomutase family protein OS=Rhodopirellula sp. SWK7 GN=RRSWK_01118 PE=3 SV=1: PGM_PMM_I: PGM_PMM_II: PGM_PMM_III: PGM_PMM_IV [Gemmataceae bacterium]VTU01618.1 phosphomannomutase : Phosphoglucomutase/phosphomannomutase family protein OS=Rhodopirellula sp. SWK7 GN=RRSWK_01118 PE=3 SV=1: PGM_PMM_I: PGM_PMM_II: PGM_PMM_III: PGM_PMM_IV [Gemmataceae bacterium]
MSEPSSLIVSVSGVRGVVGRGLTASVAARFAAAFGSTVAGKTVVVCRDGRPSGDMLRPAVIAGLLELGCTVEDIGIAPTPTCGFAVRQLQAAGGIQITASHNPAPWNGLKMFGADGAVLSAEAGAVIRGLYESGDFPRPGWDGIGTTRVPPQVERDHATAVLDTVSVAMVASQAFRVFLDANAGAGGPIGTTLLQDLGCAVVQFECDPTGRFAHPPEPIPAHLVDVAPWVPQSESAVGFVLDPDSDRLALIDETGACVSEEATLALAVKWRLRQESRPVVINMSTSRMVEDIAFKAGCPCHRSAVGEANVVAMMRETNALIGGEGNGGVIDPRVGWVRDPLAGMAFILSLMAEDKKPFSQLVAELPKYAMLKTKYEVARDKLTAAFDALKSRWPDARVNTVDGLRLDGPDWWLHVRGSNTEPVVRVIAEAPTEEQTRELCDAAGAVVTGV